MRGFASDVAGADHDDARRGDVVDAGDQRAVAARRRLQRVRAGERREAPGDARHRREQRQCSARIANGLVRDDAHARRQHGVEQRRIAIQLREAEQRRARAQARLLAALHLLDLDDQRARPGLVRIGGEHRAGRRVFGVAKAAGSPGAALDDDDVAGAHERAHPVGNDADAAFAVLGFARNADAHRRSGLSPDVDQRL